MRPATTEDYSSIDKISDECGLPRIPITCLENTISYVGDYGYFVLDSQDDTNAIIHVAVTEDGRGYWADMFFKTFVRWVFTSTRVERINAFIPAQDKHIRRFATNVGMRLLGETPMHAFYEINLIGWMFYDARCLEEGDHADSDYKFADHEMIKRVTGACALMVEGGMEHKAWYVHQLYAKLFGYKAED